MTPWLVTNLYAHSSIEDALFWLYEMLCHNFSSVDAHTEMQKGVPAIMN